MIINKRIDEIIKANSHIVQLDTRIYIIAKQIRHEEREAIADWLESYGPHESLTVKELPKIAAQLRKMTDE